MSSDDQFGSRKSGNDFDDLTPEFTRRWTWDDWKKVRRKNFFRNHISEVCFLCLAAAAIGLVIGVCLGLFISRYL